MHCLAHCEGFSFIGGYPRQLGGGKWVKLWYIK
jgi:hypothetical protein